MSKVYKIKIPLAVCINIFNKEKEELDLNLKIEVLDILEPEKMLALLKANFLTKGFKLQDKLLVLEKENGVIFSIDLANKSLKIDISNSVRDELEVSAYEEQITVKALKAMEKKDFEKIAKEKVINEQLKNELDLLDKEIKQISLTEVIKARKIINQTLKEVYKEALKEKASKMGNIVSISESDANGEYKIHLELT